MNRANPMSLLDHCATLYFDAWRFARWRLCVDASMQVLLKAMASCPWPLYASMLMRDAVTWRSSFDSTELVLPNSVDESFNQLLDSIERRLGVVFVSHALAFITVASNGLCEVTQSPTFVAYHHRRIYHCATWVMPPFELQSPQIRL